jgi:energy-converting hydrogenase Eha subunit A
MKEMSKKDKWVTAAIFTIVVVAVLLSIKLLPFYTSLIAYSSFVAGGISGWLIKYLYDKYIVKV